MTNYTVSLDTKPHTSTQEETAPSPQLQSSQISATFLRLRVLVPDFLSPGVSSSRQLNRRGRMTGDFTFMRLLFKSENYSEVDMPALKLTQ